MLKVDVLNMEGKKVGDLDLTETVFGVEVNDIVVHTALVNYLANQRQGTGSTKTRAEVRGGGRKPWKQKGTGRARQGSIRAPQWVKGGVAHGPKPRTYKYAIPKKMRQLALKSVLTSKLQEKNLIVVDKIELKEIKTKEMLKVLNNLKVSKALVMLDEKNINVQASTRNIANVKAILVNTINIFDLLKYDALVVTQDAIKKLEEVYA
ncbi:MAG: 50S ribosomal protein L4 [Clostridia bacterium]